LLGWGFGWLVWFGVGVVSSGFWCGFWGLRGKFGGNDIMKNIDFNEIVSAVEFIRRSAEAFNRKIVCRDLSLSLEQITARHHRIINQFGSDLGGLCRIDETTQIIVWDQKLIPYARRSFGDVLDCDLDIYATPSQIHFLTPTSGFLVQGYAVGEDRAFHINTFDLKDVPKIEGDEFVVSEKNVPYGARVLSETNKNTLLVSFGSLVEFLKQDVVQQSKPVNLSGKSKNLLRQMHRPKFSFVSLRRAVSANSQTPSGRRVGSDHSWIVNGHWRRQFYPSLGKHKPKFINPFVKGTGPLLERRQTVYVASR
jgi:hypothetical protein